ncbi:MAG TPA: RNA methyltransferase [Candidatus Cybelea sp.]|jgi:TrmH family RNA methyltransferase|nr:RNA methyltransferase [Candidatus Cybelea sp.]
MATRLGAHSPRLSRVRALRTSKGRAEQGRFAFEGATLLREARAGAFVVEELFVTPEAYEATPLVAETEAAGTPVYLVPPGAFRQLSSLTTPAGILAVAASRHSELRAIVGGPSPVLVLADLGDPANAGTLLRSADAFGCTGVVFGSHGIEPYHPKVVRGSMGAVFRLEVAVAGPDELRAAATAAGLRLLGLDTRGSELAHELGQGPGALIIGHERHGLGRWKECCDALVAIPMRGRAESLSAGVAGSIALFEATRTRSRQ